MTQTTSCNADGRAYGLAFALTCTLNRRLRHRVMPHARTVPRVHTSHSLTPPTDPVYAHAARSNGCTSRTNDPVTPFWHTHIERISVFHRAATHVERTHARAHIALTHACRTYTHHTPTLGTLPVHPTASTPRWLKCSLFQYTSSPRFRSS